MVVLHYDFGDYELSDSQAISALAQIVAKEINAGTNDALAIKAVEHLLDVADTITLDNICCDWEDQLKDWFYDEAQENIEYNDLISAKDMRTFRG